MAIRTQRPLRLAYLLSFWFGLILALGATSPSACEAQDRIISIMNAAGLPGSQIKMELRLDELLGFAGGDFAVGFDPAVISILDVNKTPVTNDFLLYHGSPSPGRVTISMAAAEGLADSGPGAIATFELLVNGNAASGAFTVVSLRTARWYDELSERHTLLGDNGLLSVDSISPDNAPLTLALEDASGQAGNEISLPLTLSMGHSAGKVIGDLNFDPLSLTFSGLELVNTFEDWTSQVQTGTGTLHFILSNTKECVEPGAVEIGTISFSITGSIEPGTILPVGLSATSINNLEGLFYSHITIGGMVHVETPVEPTPTPTAEFTPTPTSTPLMDDPHLADFNGDGTVDQTDLILFLETWHQELPHP